MKIGIVGTGAVGGYFGGKLAQAGNEVTFIARNEQLKALKSKGLTVLSVKGDFIIFPVRATDNVYDLTEMDLIILCVKAWQINAIAEDLAKIISEKTLVLPLQNGVLAAEELRRVISPEQVLGGLCMIFSKIKEPGVIEHMGLTPSITFGEFERCKPERLEALKNLFDSARIENTLSSDINAALWRKFMLICLSGLGALTKSGYGMLRSVPETRQIIIDILTEIAAIAKAKKINLEDDIVEQSLLVVDSYPSESISSLARDVINGQPSEIEDQNGCVVRFGEELGIKTPANKFIYSLLKPIELNNRNKKN